MGRGTLTAIIIIILVIVGGITSLEVINNRNNKNTITICTAGSMAQAMRDISQLYTENTNINVRIRSQGSVDIVRGIIDLGLNCNVVVVADYRLIPLYLHNITNWYIVYASNEMVIAWSNNTRPPSNLSQLLKELEEGSATLGISDPNRDPCGYRAIGVIGLLSIYNNDSRIVRELVVDRIPGSRIEWRNNTLNIYIPPSYTPRGNLVIRPKSIQLISLLESGEIKYAILYKSEAVQHHLHYIELPESVNLGDPRLKSEYSRVIVHILTGTRSERSIRMAPIAYGITIPIDTGNNNALSFIKLLLERNDILEKYGFTPLNPPIAYGRVPQELRGLVRIEG